MVALEEAGYSKQPEDSTIRFPNEVLEGLLARKKLFRFALKVFKKGKP